MPNEHYPSLFLLVNSERARWFRLNGRGAEEIVAIIDPFQKYSDRESFFTRSGRGESGRVGEQDVVNARKKEHLMHHLRLVSKKTKEIMMDEEYRYITCAIPEELKYEFLDHVTFVGNKLHFVFGNFLYIKESDIPDLFVKSLRPYG